MTSRPRALPSCRHVLAAPIAAIVLLAAAACGSDDTSAEPAPESGSPTTASSSATPTPTPSETPTTRPVSPYENDPMVKVLRTWAEIIGKGVPRRDVSKLVTVSEGEALSAVTDAVREDFGTEWLGPLPLTPVQVKRAGSAGRVVFCMQTKGWALDAETHAPIDSQRKVVAAESTFTKKNGRWVMTTWYSADVDCSSIRVMGVAW